MATTNVINGGTGPVQRFSSSADDDRARAIIKEKDRRKSRRENWDTLWEEITQEFLPNKDDIHSAQSNTRSGGDRKGILLLDTTGAHSATVLSNNLHSTMTNPAAIWAAFAAKNPDIKKLPQVTKWLQKLVKGFISVLNQSNFQTQIHEMYNDLTTLGTAPFEVNEDDDFHVRFKSKPIFHYYVKENANGIIDDTMTEEKLTVEQAFQKYGEEAFGSEVINLKQDMNKNLFFIHSIAPRDAATRMKFSSTSLGHAYSSIHVWREKAMIVKEGGFEEFPIMFPRWSKLSDEEYGRSPAMTASPDVKMLQTMMRTTVRGAQKIVDPPLMIPDDGILGSVNSAAGGLNTYRSGTTDRIFPIETKGDPGIGMDLMNEVRDRVKKIFFVDQLQLHIGPQMTATEVNARIEQQLRLLGPLLGRLHFELLQPLVTRVLKIMERKKLLPPNPPAEIAGDFELEVFFTSAIAQAQRAAEANKLRSFLTTLEPIVAFDPSAADLVDVDKAVREIGELEGINQELFRDDDELEELREAKAAKQQQAEEDARATQGAEQIQKAGPVLQSAGVV